MVEQNFNIFNFKSQPSLEIEKENDDNNDIVITDNDNNNNDGNKNSKDPKFNYVKILVKDPLNNREIMAVSPKHKNSFSIGYKKNTYMKYSTSVGRAPHLIRNVASSFSKLHPYFITGFIDGEGCFSIAITNHNKLKTG